MSKIPILVPVFPYEVLARFKQEKAFRAAGLHLLSAWGTTSARGTSPFAALHEDMHDRILSTTAFGFAQKCLSAYFQPQVAPRWTKFATRWSRALSQESVRTHEIAATYLPIKLLQSADHAQALSYLSPQYRGYYDSLASVIDNHATSSFLQYAIGETVVFTAFLSPLVERLVTADCETPVRIRPDESPNKRFNRVRSLLANGGTAHLWATVRMEMENAAREAGVGGFDANHENDWIQLNNRQLDTLGTRLCAEVRRWFADRNYGGVRIPHVPDLAAAANRFIDQAKERGVVIGNADFDDGFDWLDGEEARGAYSAADSVFFNEPVVDRARNPRMPTNSFWVSPVNPPATISVICVEEASTPRLNHQWYVRTCGRTGNCGTCVVSQLQLVEFLSERNREFAESGHCFDNDLYVVGLPAPVTAESRELTLSTMNAVFTMFAVPEPGRGESAAGPDRMGRYLGLDRLVFYMHGSLLAWASFVAGLTGARYFTYTQLEDPRYKPPLQPPRGGIGLKDIPIGVELHAMRCDVAPVTFLRVLNPWASLSVLAAVEKYANRTGKLTLLHPDSEEVVRAEAFLALAASTIEAAWSVY